MVVDNGNADSVSYDQVLFPYNLMDHNTTSATTMPTKKYATQTLVMGLVQCWARQVASDHDLDETLTNIIPAFDYFAFTDPSRL